ncbi:hypothetical protein BHU72_14860 [Desulfuribacillus stibiiarsenatis]|uniref:Copper amine oxidase-like N-terminal domain-containing protein n=1 Tax=Desulfuribacillus stibiiarsenatis TaxID=1390249 RepID=A0A1E5L7C3_9FIRM|nr:copper amine oxidase N-terminal domain-containing protein [Desulfuribacillus stibiiarsenatis]OEH86031.1 hypothetical protein BHU72_14860 [Desulfuribacillus stibiiarsenatis]
MKKIIGLLCTVIITVLSASFAGAQDINITLNGVLMDFPQPKPYIGDEGRVLVPVRFISETMGAEVNWDAEAKEVSITYEGNTVVFTPYSWATHVIKNGEKIEIGTRASNRFGRVYVPLRFVSEMLEADVEWESSTKTVHISKESLNVNQLTLPENRGLTMNTPTTDFQPTKPGVLPPSALPKEYPKDWDERQKAVGKVQEEHYYYADRVLEKIKLKDDTLIVYFPELSNGYYYRASYLLIKKDDSKENVFIFNEDPGWEGAVVIDKDGIVKIKNVSNYKTVSLWLAVSQEKDGKYTGILGNSMLLLPDFSVIRDSFVGYIGDYHK